MKKSLPLLTLCVCALFVTAQNQVQSISLPTLNSGTNGVLAMKIDSAENVLWIGGEFTTVGGFNRRAIAAIDLTTYAVKPWTLVANPALYVSAIEITDSLVYYSTGNPFAEHVRVANKFTGDTIPGFSQRTFLPVSSGYPAISMLKVVGNFLYVGGYYQPVSIFQNDTIAFFCRINRFNGSLDSTWNIKLNDEVLAMEVNGNQVFIGGYFTKVLGQTRNGVAVLNLSNMSLTGVNYNFSGIYSGNYFKAFLRRPSGVLAQGYGYNYSKLFPNGTMVERANSYVNRGVGVGQMKRALLFARNNGNAQYVEVLDTNFVSVPFNATFPALPSGSPPIGQPSSPTVFASSGGKIFVANYSTSSNTIKFFRGYHLVVIDSAKIQGNLTIVCQNQSFNVTVNAESNFNADNKFIVEISDANGSFNSPTQIGSLDSSFYDYRNMVIPCAVPTNVPAGLQYRVRVRTTSPASISYPNGSNLRVTGVSLTPDSIYIRRVSNNVVYNSNTICDTLSVYLEATYTNSANQLNNTGYTWNIPSSWTWLDTLNYPKNSRVIKVRPSSGVFPVSVIAFNGCGAAQPKSVTITSNLQIINPTNIRIISDKLCLGDTIRMVADLSSNTPGQNYQWSVGSSHNIIMGGTQNKDTVLSKASNGMAGNIHSMNLRVFNECGVGTQLNLPYQVYTTPQFGFNNTILGTRRICSPDTINLTVSGYNYASVDSFLFTIKSGSIPITPTISALPTFSFFATSSDTVEARVRNYCGTTPGFLKHILSFTSPVDSIFAQDSVCSGGSPVFSLYPPNNNFDSAFWTYPAGWNTQFLYDNYNMRVDRSFFTLSNSYTSVYQSGGFVGSYPSFRYQSGLVSVTAYNPCGVYQFSKYINVTNYPFPSGTPNNSIHNTYSTIDSAFCMLDPFTITALSDTSITRYNWFLPVGWSSIGDTTSSSITVQLSSMLSDTIFYQPSNRCYNSIFKYPKVVYPGSIAPNSPDSISILGSSCIGDTIALQASFVNNAKAYVWEVPAAWIVVGKADSSLIRVIATTEDSIRVRAVNSCDTSSSSGFKTIELIPADNIFTAASDSEACKGGVITFSSSGGQSYLWQGLGQNSTDSVVQFTINTSGKVVANVIGNCKQVADTFNIRSLDELVWPGDANNDKVVNQNDILAIGLAFSESGPIRRNASALWTAQCAASWQGAFSTGENYAHADADGNGVVDYSDTTLVSLNFGLVHAKNAAERSGSIPLVVQLDKASAKVGDTITGQIVLGNINEPANDVYGIAGQLDIGLSIKQGSLKFNQQTSWLTSAADLRFNRQLSNSTFAFAQSKINRQNVSGYGTIASFVFVADSNTAGQKNVTLADAIIINAFNDTLGVNASNATLSYSSTSVSVNEVREINILVYPNPANDVVFIDVKANNCLLILTDLTGRTVKKSGLENGVNVVDVSTLQTGLYHYSIADEKGVLKRGSLVVR